MTTKTYSAEFAGDFTAKMTIGLSGLTVEWHPRVPQLDQAQMAAYRDWRNTCLADYAQGVGGSVVLVET